MKLLLVTTISLLSSLAFANDIKCDYNGNQQQLNVCAYDEYKAADATLNVTWKRVVGCMETTEQTDLLASLKMSQRAWIRYKEDHCVFIADSIWGAGPAQGSGWSLGYSDCLRQMTEEKNTQLNALLASCEGN